MSLSNSFAERYCARVVLVLMNVTQAQGRVFRARLDAMTTEECPALNVIRISTDMEILGERLQRLLLGFNLECFATGEDWESAADALHVAAHGALFADLELASLGHGLLLTGTESEGVSADFMTGRITARYRVQAAIHMGALATIY